MIDFHSHFNVDVSKSFAIDLRMIIMIEEYGKIIF